MILLDTDHVSILRMPPSQRQTRLVARMSLPSNELFEIPIVVVEETMRGWLAAIAKERIPLRQVSAYRELSSLFAFFAAFPITPSDQAAADRFELLRTAKVRIATRDLKIAAICLADDAMLLTANRQDFEKVLGLRFETWLS